MSYINILLVLHTGGSEECVNFHTLFFFLFDPFPYINILFVSKNLLFQVDLMKTGHS